MAVSHLDAGSRSRRAAARGRFALAALSLDGPGGSVPVGGGTVGFEVLGPGLIRLSLTRHCKVQLLQGSEAAFVEVRRYSSTYVHDSDTLFLMNNDQSHFAHRDSCIG
jgi:hypothetical protein